MQVSAFAYVFLVTVVVAFQVALALGAPWGAYAMGGSMPGRLPLNGRVASLVQAAFLTFTALVVLSRAGLALQGMSSASHWLVWMVVGLLTLSLVGNLLSKSAGERKLWVPVLILMLMASVAVGIVSR